MTDGRWWGIPLRLLGFFALSLGAIPVLWAAAGKNTSPSLPIEQVVLPNGLRVVLAPVEGPPVVAVMTHFDVGARRERHDQEGYSAFTSALLSQGNHYLPVGQIPPLLAERGGRGGAQVQHDSLCFWEVVPTHELPLALWLEGGRMLGLPGDGEQLPAYDIAPVILPAPSPYLAAFLMGGERLFRLKLPSVETLARRWRKDRAAQGELSAFHRRYVTPNNGVLTLVGQFEPRRVLQQISRYLGDIPRGPPLAPIPPVPPRNQGEPSHLDLPAVDGPAVVFTFPVPLEATVRRDALKVAVEALFGEGHGSLHTALVQPGRARRVLGGMAATPGPMMAYGLIEVGPGTVDDVVAEATDHLRRLGAAPTQTAVDAAVSALDARSILMRADHVVLARALGQTALRSNDPSSLNRVGARLSAVTPALVAEVAASYMGPDRRVLIRVNAEEGP